jgi:hypothetical protein
MPSIVLTYGDWSNKHIGFVELRETSLPWASAGLTNNYKRSGPIQKMTEVEGNVANALPGSQLTVYQRLPTRAVLRCALTGKRLPGLWDTPQSGLRWGCLRNPPLRSPTLRSGGCALDGFAIGPSIAGCVHFNSQQPGEIHELAFGIGTNEDPFLYSRHPISHTYFSLSSKFPPISAIHQKQPKNRRHKRLRGARGPRQIKPTIGPLIPFLSTQRPYESAPR